MHSQRHLVRSWIVGVVAVLATALGLVAFPQAAQASSCTSPTFSVYPGSATGRMRYGQVDFHFDGCNDQSPSGWKATVTKSQVNSTGKNLGFFIDGTSIRSVRIGDGYADYEGIIAASSCTPRVGWPCSSSYSFTAQFHMEYNRYGTPYVTMTGLSAPIGMALFETP